MSERQYEDKYLGPKKIKLTQAAGTTRGGSELLEVVFDDNSREVWAKAMLDSEGVLTPQAGDLSGLRIARLYPVVEKILGILRDYNVKVDEVNFVTQLVATSVNSNNEKANTWLWKLKDIGEQTLNDIDRIMAEIPPTLNDVIPGNK